MQLILGGYAQGKLGYVLERYSLCQTDVWDAALSDIPWKGQRVVYHTEALIHRWILAEKLPEEEIAHWLPLWKDSIVILQEMGSGLVPVTPQLRIWREAVGRMGQRLAKEADSVVRVCCGMGMVLKGEP